jgi:phosphatidylinositol glycan class B
MFGALLEDDGVRKLLVSKEYEEVWSAGREWEGEGRRKGGVRVWKSLLAP